MWDQRMRNNSVPGEQYFGHELPLRQGQQRRLPVVVDHVTKAEAAMHQGALYRPPPEGHEFPPEYSEEARPVLPTSLKTDPYSCEATKTFRSASLTAVNSVSVKDRIALFSQCGSSPSVTNGGPAVPACSTLPRTPCNSVQSTIPNKPVVTTAISESKPPSPLSRWHSAASLLTASDRRPSYVSTYPETQLLRRPGYERSSSSSTLLTSYLQERRSSTSSKLKGLVIPQGPSKQTTATSVLPLIGPSASWRPAPLIPTSFQLSHSKPVTPPVPERPVLVSPVRSSIAPTTPPPLPPTSPPPLPPVSTVPLQSKPTLPVTLINGLDCPPPAANSTKPFRNPIERLDSLLGTGILAQQNVKTPDLPTPDSGPSSISETISGNVQQVSPSKPSLSPPPITAQRTQSAPNTIENSSSSRSRFWSLRDDSDDDSNSVISLRTEDSRQTADDSLSDADSLHQERSEFRPRRLSQQRTVLATTTNTIVSKQQQPTTDSVSQFRALAEKWESRSLTNGPAVVAPSLVTSSTTSITTSTYQTGTNPRSPRNGTESNKLPPSLQPRSVIQDSKSVLPLLERSLSSLDLVGSRLQKSSRSVSVSDIRKSFETKKQVAEHKRFSSMDSTASDSGVGTPGGLYGSASSLHAGNNSVGVDGFGSTTSLASDECCPQTPPTPATSSLVLQGLLDESAAQLEAESAGLGAQCQLDAVVLHKDSPQGPVGVTLAGGADYEIKEITIHKVIVGGLADRDGRLRKGDRILSINGLSLQGQTHRQALDLLKAHRQEVILIVCKETSPRKILDTRPGHLSNGQPLDKSKNSSNAYEDKSSALVSTTTSLSKGKANPSLPAGVIQLHLLKDGAGLGFSLDGGQGSPLGDRPLTVKRVFKGGAADREGHLGVGDQVLYVGSQSVTSMTRTEAWNYMKKLPDGPVTLTVRPLLEEAPPN